MIKSKNSKRQGEFHIEKHYSLEEEKQLEDQNGFHCKLNVIQAYMKLYVMQGLRVGIREWVSRY